MPFGGRKSCLQACLQSLRYIPPSQSQCLHLFPSRSFSSTVTYHGNALRAAMFKWLNGPGAIFKDPPPQPSNYLGVYKLVGENYVPINKQESKHDTPKEVNTVNISGEEDNTIQEPDQSQSQTPEPALPSDEQKVYPKNPHFKSQRVLSEELKDQIWHRVVVLGQSVQTVSTELKVEMRRIGAVVRLKTIEKQWVEQGKPLATPYASAILKMLPQTNYHGGRDQPYHESINDLPVHRATLTQLFHPVSESRHFTRRDAGKVFDRGLLPAEDRIPHPHLVELEALRFAGIDEWESDRIIKKMMQEKEEQRTASRKEWQEHEKKLVKKILPGGKTARAEFRFRDISVELAGKDGRGRKGVGMRYGIPSQDRKKGQVKIPTKVEL